MAENPKPRILIVEDNLVVLETYKFLFGHDFEVTGYGKSNELVSDIVAEKLDLGSMDAAVLDQNLGQGQLSGNELLGVFQREDRTLAVVIATAEEQTSIDALNQNAFRFVVKKDDFLTPLMQRIRECVQQTRSNRAQEEMLRQREMLSVSAQVLSEQALIAERRQDDFARAQHDASHQAANLIGQLSSIASKLSAFANQPNTDTQQEVKSDIQVTLRQMAALSSTLAEPVSRLKSTAADHVDLLPFWAYISASFSHERRVRFTEDLTPPIDPARIKIRANALEATLINLIKNALLYSPAPAPVTLEFRVRRQQTYSPATAEHEQWYTPSLAFGSVGPAYCIMDVTDAGPGIPPERLLTLFDVRPKRDDGHGFGLANCLTAVTECCGSIAVKSQPGSGSVFRLVLPVEPTESA
jgi:signal transduction histidine kinase